MPETRTKPNAALLLACFALSVGVAFLGGKAIAQDIAPLSAADVTTIRSAPVRASQWSVTLTSVGTTEGALVDGAIADVENIVQELRISNRHASNDLCYTVIDRVTTGATGCATDCTALADAALTCSGGANDGDIIKAGVSLPFTITGKECLCGEASGASTTTTVARVLRYPL